MHACLAVTVGRTRCLLGARCLGVACPGGRCLQDGRWALPAGRGLGAALGAALGASGRGGAGLRAAGGASGRAALGASGRCALGASGGRCAGRCWALGLALPDALHSEACAA